MAAVPATAPLTMPDVGVTAAILLEEEVHNPPVVPSVSAVVAPAHREKVPAAIVAGKGLTVSIA